jgi:CHAT domain-containing protein
MAQARRSANLDRRHLTALPATAAEVLAAARLFAGDDELAALQLAGRPEDFDGELQGRRFTALLGRAASEQALRAADLREVRFLHLACHGFADPQVAELSCLVLTPSGREAAQDGLLRAADLASLRGEYELVALSACDSGDGPLRHGEGQASLARAAMAIGARRVLATLWQVEDGAAAGLVVDFYRAWLVDGMAAAAALADAQRKADERGVPTRDWAAFVLWGEAR